MVPYDAGIEEQVRQGLEFMSEHRVIFRALAKT
jgi:hypothetical protein